MSIAPSRRVIAYVVALLGMSGFGHLQDAFAQPKSGAPTPGEKLFREGRDAMDRKELALACSKFAESYQLEHVVTSLLNQADCEEKRGRLATSLALWRTGADKADDATTKSFAEKRLTALLPRVPTLTIHVGAKTLKNATLTVDGSTVVLDTHIPTDPGDHVIEAKAPTGESETQKVTLDEGKSREVTVLATASTAPIAPTTGTPSTLPPDTAPRKSSHLKTAGYAVGAVGVAGIAVFAVSGIVVLADHGSCPHFTCTKDKRPNALLGVNAAGLAIGVVGLAIGIPLVVVGTQKEGKAKETPDAPRADLFVGPTYGGAAGAVRVSF